MTSCSLRNNVEPTDVASIGAVGTIGFLGLVTNCIILAALIRSKKIRKNAYISLVLLMCVTNVVICTHTTISAILRNATTGESKISPLRCRINFHIIISGIAFSFAQLLLVCINRLLATSTDAKINKFLFHDKRKYVTTAIFFLLIQIYFFSMLALPEDDDVVDPCKVCFLHSDDRYAKSLIIFAYGALFIAVLVVYCKTIYRIKHRIHRVNPIVNTTVLSVIDIGNKRKTTCSHALELDGMDTQRRNQKTNTKGLSILDIGNKRNLNCYLAPESEERNTQRRKQSANIKGLPVINTEENIHPTYSYAPESERIKTKTKIERTPRDLMTIRALITLSILLLSFSVFVLPFIIVFTLDVTNIYYAKTVKLITIILLFLRYITNPILFTWRFKELRTELSSMFRLKKNCL